MSRSSSLLYGQGGGGEANVATCVLSTAFQSSWLLLRHESQVTLMKYVVPLDGFLSLA